MRVAVVGGGPAGFFGAIRAAEYSSSASITLFEATNEPLSKVRLSGGGRCNVTHSCFDPSELVKNYPRGSKELLGPFHRFQPKDIVAWFEERSVKLKVENDGRIFPQTNKSSTIVNCLLNAAEKASVKVRLRCRVKSISYSSDNNGRSQFHIKLHDNSVEQFDRVLLATGSSPNGYSFATGLNHSIVPCVPSLFTFKISDQRLEQLSGATFENVCLRLSSGKKRYKIVTGPMLITHWGLSGPAVLKLSAFAARELHESKYRETLHISFLPSCSGEQVYKSLLDFKENNGKKFVRSDMGLPIPKRYWERIVRYVGIGDTMTWTHLSREEMQRIVIELTDAEFRIVGKGIFKEEFVTCGGVNLKEVDFKTMQSKQTAGLYFAGEILDIDGITGGFNFQNAWTTGYIAGSSMAEQNTSDSK